MRRFSVALFAGVACASCGAHPGLGASHELYRHVFAHERVSPEAGERSAPVVGLDSQEAAIISQAYRYSLAPKGIAPTGDAVLLVQPDERGARKAMP